MASSEKEIVLADERQLTPSSTDSIPFSIFTPSQKRWILFLTGFAGAFSPLSSFIFYPAIVPIALGLGVTVGLVNLALTTYLVVSGIVPSILGNAADKIGRRPVYILALFIYFAANIGLAAQNNYAALLVLRMLQSAGISGTISLGYGIISDIATPSERGSYVGIFALGPNVGPPLGPVIGGAIAASLGWRWIFWFLAITGGVCLLMIVLALPETARPIVGNGSIPATGINRTLLSVFSSTCRGSRDKLPRGPVEKTRRASLPNPLASLKLLLEPDLFILLLCNGIYYSTGSCVQASLSSIFIQVYGYKELEAGLVYLPFGVGCLANVYLWGKFLDFEYRRIAKSHGFDPNRARGELMSDFPIELARLRGKIYLVFLTVAGMVGYGWAVQKQASFGTLITDLNPGRSSTAAASANIVRCSLAAALTAALQPIIDAIGAGWCFTIYGLLVATCVPLLLFQIKIGPGRRKLRKDREAHDENDYH
ncbi:hypothetical protein O1611_g812 [Lasiodiplodia mahajangana]|uniref:Uncharacterized protein n=1 Tax=Lasiodiplodia mahajangana TaxID=1108764 RepID=A0ACC2JZ54_9PEZI|nr:hypothetical protein O1611_g812 [Lasiodiplodia mahajangana]